MARRRIPRGWSEWDPCSGDNNRPVECSNCDWKGREDECDDYIPDLQERIEPGMIVPVGVCPAIHTDSRDGDYPCGSLVYYSDVEIIYRKVPNVLERIAEEV